MSAAVITPAPAPSMALDEGRIGLRANLRHIGALARRNMLQIKQDPESMFDVLLMPIVFTLLFVYVFGGALEGNTTAYVNYMVPGLMAMMGMNIAMAVGTGVNSDFQTGVMDRFRTMPIARSSVLIAKIVVEIGRALIATAILLAVGFILGLHVSTSVFGLLAAVALSTAFGASLMWIFILLGLTAKTPQSVQALSMIVVLPLQFGSSIFAKPTTMPGWLQSFTKANPLSNLADASRALINGGPVAHSVWMTLAWAVGITAISAPWPWPASARRPDPPRSHPRPAGPHLGPAGLSSATQPLGWRHAARSGRGSAKRMVPSPAKTEEPCPGSTPVAIAATSPWPVPPRSRQLCWCPRRPRARHRRPSVPASSRTSTWPPASSRRTSRWSRTAPPT